MRVLHAMIRSGGRSGISKRQVPTANGHRAFVPEGGGEVRLRVEFRVEFRVPATQLLSRPAPPTRSRLRYRIIAGGIWQGIRMAGTDDNKIHEVSWTDWRSSGACLYFLQEGSFTFAVLDTQAIPTQPPE